MNFQRPRLTILLAWIDQSAPALDDWRASSTAADTTGAALLAVVDRFEAGEWLGEPTATTPEQLAAYLDGKLATDEVERFEDACLASPADLADLVSAWRFRQSAAGAKVEPALTARLLALVPQVVPASAAWRMPGRRRARWFGVWQVAVAALVVMTAAAGILAAISWRRARHEDSRDDIATDGAGSLHPHGLPSDITRSKSPDEHSADRERIVQSPDSPFDRRAPQTPDDLPQRPDEIVRTPRPPQLDPVPPDAPQPETPRRTPNPATFASLSVHSELGLLLVRSDSSDKWRFAPSSFVLDRAVDIVSLDDSWSTVEIPDIGTLVWQGPVEARLRTTDEGSLRIDLDRGKLGVRDLAAGAKIDFRVQGEQFRATGVGDYSTMAVVNDPRGATAFVSSGIIAVDQASVSANQVIPLVRGVWLPPPSLTAAAAARPGLFVDNPYDPEWLQDPDDRKKREWRNQYAKLANKLRQSEDVATTITELRSLTKDTRQLAMLARWNVSLSGDRAQAVWELLNDRHETVRAAGVKSLLALPPREARALLTNQRLRDAVGEATADRLIEWTIAARGSRNLNANHAREMVDHLQHVHVAVRQIAVWLLEQYSAPAFQQLRRKPPVYDAAAPVAKRAVAQAEWRQIVLQLFSARANANPVAPQKAN